MEKPRLPLPKQVLTYALGSAVLGPWSLHSLARHLYPRLREELQKQQYPEANNLPLLWWFAWPIATALGSAANDDTHAIAAAVLYIICGWVQAGLSYFITYLYPHGLPQVEPTYRHYKLNEWLEVWLPTSIGLPLLLLAAGCGVGTCLFTALGIVAVAAMRSKQYRS